MTTTKITTIITLIISISLMSFTGNENGGWLTNYAAAVAQAKKENKMILMDFSGSDWCVNCIRLEKSVFATETFKNYAKDKFILLNVDFPVRKKNKLSPELTKQNEGLAEIYNKAGQFPTIIILDKNEKTLAKTGYKEGGPEIYIQHLNSLLNKK